MVELLLAALLACDRPEPMPSPERAAPSTLESKSDIFALEADPDAIIAHRADLTRLLTQHPDPGTRKIAIGALSAALDRESIPTMVDALWTEPDPSVALWFIAAFVRLNDPLGVDAAIEFWLTGPDPSIDDKVRIAILGMSPAKVLAGLDAYRALNPSPADRLRAEIVEREARHAANREEMRAREATGDGTSD